MNKAVKVCNICKSELSAPIYDSRSLQSLTSLCRLYPGSTQVWFCTCCGHVLSNPLEGTDEYYATEYDILLDHEDEDQIYEVKGGEITYRIDRQLAVICQKVQFRPGMKVLDYGCAKAGMSKRLDRQVPGMEFYFFDVSDRYLEYWQKLAPSHNHAILATPAHWENQFDLITSYFSLEHIPDPVASIAHITSMLKKGGLFYAIVPDIFGNIADFIVVDHVNHFTRTSLAHLLQGAGLSVVDIDSASHRGALVVVARNGGEVASLERDDGLQQQVQELAHYWGTASRRVQQARVGRNGSCAIYGSGFYGTFIYSMLADPHEVACFLDQSPYQQGKSVFGVPVISPEALPEDIKTLFVGLNPAIAREVIAGQPCLQRPDLRTIYLDS